ncbi:Uu.00g119340.m01.CDS01 [Anthostomella pinea]|uniref:Uu.00g119340.m01.CDS01 n=1 Tax=Anthostomella pinea TaxID=933095 RepID=A0AAI8VHK1_9PEZI|nr:Uu.00g119340.m01.CDS01 [Anthostomella pinea]
MAILRSPHKRLLLPEIYKWISDTYSFYDPKERGWKNSIRHNLSLNPGFIKQERLKGAPGSYWTIEPGKEQQFMKEETPLPPPRKSTPATSSRT